MESLCCCAVCLLVESEGVAMTKQIQLNIKEVG